MPASLLSQVLAQDTAVATLRRALARQRVHHAYLFDGPDGVGKELAALGLAQALVCERRTSAEAAPAGGNVTASALAATGDACGECSACRRVPLRPDELRPLHPDVAILERGLYEPAQIGRRTPETQDLSIDQIRTLVLARAAFAPHEGRAKVFILRRAEELSIAAANALLKTLEEPGRGTHFILLSARPDSLLTTIRSRTQRIRFGLLPDAVVERLLEARNIEAPRSRAIARVAGGSMAQALHHADPELSGAREVFVTRALGALGAADLGPAFELAEEAKKVKGDLDSLLGAFALALAEEGRRLANAAAGSQKAPSAGPTHAAGNASGADVAAARFRLALAAQRQLASNGAAQLVIEAMFIRMRAL